MTSSSQHDTMNISGVKKDTNMNKKGKYMVFDVDETLGYFSQPNPTSFFFISIFIYFFIFLLFLIRHFSKKNIHFYI